MFRLCLKLGFPHPEYLEELITVRQLNDWIEYYAAEPWGFPVEDERSALSNLVTVKSAGGKSAKIEHFRMQTDAGGGEQNDDDEYRLAKEIRKAFGLPPADGPPPPDLQE